MGVRVVGVEPNPELALEIGRRYGGRPVEAGAVGAEPGRAELSLGRDTGHSTLSKDWIERAPT